MEHDTTAGATPDINAPGSATNPGGAPDIAGLASANITYVPYLPSSDLDGACIGSTARGYKTSALSALQAIGPTGSNDTDKKINEAIKKVTSSLARPNWVDDNHIDGREAEKIFTDEKAAVTQLMGIKGTVPAGATAAIQYLLEADRILAQTAIDDAVGGKPKPLAEAAKEMQKALDSIAKGDFDNAIDHYKHAWQQAQKA